MKTTSGVFWSFIKSDLKAKSIILAYAVLLFAVPTYASFIDLPRTGQTQCFDNDGALLLSCVGTGQDGETQAGVAWPTPRFSDNGDQTVTDNLSGLIWAKAAGTPTVGICTGGPKTWTGALDYIACLNTVNYLSHNDWRLPNIVELTSLIDRSMSFPALPSLHPFTDVQLNNYWTSTTEADNSVFAWDINILDGSPINDYKDLNYYYVLPVRGGQCGSLNQLICLHRTGQSVSYYPGDDGAKQYGVAWPVPRFTLNATPPDNNRSVIDNLTGLIWAADAASATGGICTGNLSTWQSMLDYVTCLNTNNYLGHNDWRLPNIVELTSLIDHSRSFPSLPSAYPFSNVQSSYFSSSTYAYDLNLAWCGDFIIGGGSGFCWKPTFGISDNVWPVRGGQSTCTYSISPDASFSSGGGIGSVTITTRANCNWSANSDDSWITITSINSGTGIGTLSYSVQSHSGMSQRMGTITIAGQPFTITQDGQSTSSVLLRQTGQATCYDVNGYTIPCKGTGQDGEIRAGVSWPTNRFAVNNFAPDNGGSITDTLTGLIWAKNAGTPTIASCTGGYMTQRVALDYIACLNSNNYLGHHDWRLPNNNELSSLVNSESQSVSSWLTDQGFSNVYGKYLSSSSFLSDKAMYVDMRDGRVSWLFSDETGAVWPVRGRQCGTAGNSLTCLQKTGQVISYYPGDDGAIRAGLAWPVPRFRDNGNGTVTDNLTGLIWLKNAHCIETVSGITPMGYGYGTLTWAKAILWTNGLYSGKCGLNDGSVSGDWRLPNREELMSLLDYGQSHPALPSGYPFNDVRSGYWSSTTYAKTPANAWYLNIDVAPLDNIEKTSYAFVLPVHVIQPGPSIDPPSNLAAKAISSYKIVLSWKDNSEDETGIKIERKSGACGSANPWSQIATKGANVTTHTNTGLTANTTYSYRVRAYNAAGNSSYSNCASAKTGVSGTPNSPTNLSASSVSTTTVKLLWTDNSTDETSFKVYRKVGTGSWSLLTTKGSNIVSHTDTGATGNTNTTAYSYYVQACNSSGCSPATNSAVVPYRPINLAATAASSSRINLAWADKSSNETGFQIERKSGGCSSTNSWSKIKTVGQNIISYGNSGLASGETYSYRIRAYKKSSAAPYAYGYSTYSNCKSATTP